ncbi:MAG: ABC transporter permease [Lachnospiraceae bacterium]|nr:ABC transporter permease [Lachnospiraceae bacterium]
MLSIFKHELKLNLKSLLIWSLSVGGLGFVCLLMYTSMEGEMMDMADTFSNMGAFSDAFGMSTLSIATINGFFATEVGTVHGLGSALFAALLATVLLSKEEDAHTGEFLFSLPVSRGMTVLAKLLSLLAELVIFTLICGALYILGFAALKEDISWKEMMIFLGSMLLMNIEISAVALIISACSARNRMGIGLGLALIFYSYDLIGRVVPDMKDYLFLGPFSYTNASEIFAGKETPAAALITGAAVIITALLASFTIYMKKDLA